MKKFFTIIIASILVISLSACSGLNEVTDTVDYATVATEHVENLTTFAENAPDLINEAANSLPAKEELETQLLQLKEDIENFISLTDIPTVAEDIHQELVQQNELLLAEINNVIQDGHLMLDQLQSSEIITTINNATSLMSRIENLGL